MYEEDLQTGDLLLFNERPKNCCMGMLDYLIKICTGSLYSHSAIVLKNPSWVSVQGLYIWESTYSGLPDPQDNLIKFGVQTTPLSRYTQFYPGRVTIYVRKNNVPGLWTREILDKIHKRVYRKSYDILPQDWIEALIQRNLFLPRTNRFFCSAFSAYLLSQVGVISPKTNWTRITPRQLSAYDEKNGVIWLHPYGEDICVKTK